MSEEEHEVLQEIRSDIKAIHVVLRGDDKGQLGLIHQVRFMWKSFWLWPLCSLSAGIGFVAHIVILKILH